MTDVILHDYWRSSAAYRVRVALNLKGIGYQARSVNLLTGAHKQPENIHRNPQGLLPTLEIDGLTLTQSLAIIEYLDETRPDPRLIPEDAAGRHRVRALSAVVAMEIHPVCNLSVARYATGAIGMEMGAWMRRFIPPGLAALEVLLRAEPESMFCHGNTPTLADCCVIPQLYNARRWEVPLDAYPRLSAIEARCAALPAFQAAHPDTVGAPPE